MVDEVFDKCYADLEPIGRRARSYPTLAIWIFAVIQFFSGMLTTSKGRRMKSFCLATVNPGPILDPVNLGPIFGFS